MPEVRVQLGDFTLREVIGRGGMGEVWRGVHQRTGAPVAVKLDLAPPTPEYRAAFFHEVRLIAGLDHPNCVQVLDAGTVTASDDISAGRHLQVGTPWLAMELALGGACDRRNPPRTWDALHHVLRSLLVALQHAHSRGVIHRDIKFGNLLMAGPPGDLATVPATYTEARVVLSDFGIGHSLFRPEARAEHSAGTPHYMAPEQIEGDWRAHGPWTDLYQAGIFAWCLATGRFPFRGNRPVQLLAAHLSHEPPVFQPAMLVPDGLEPILRQMLAKAPAERFRFAAHAIEALDKLPHPGGAPAQEHVLDEEMPTITLGAGSDRETLSGPTGASMARPSAGLFGLKLLPLLGRGPEQSRLQIGVRRVIARRSPDLVLLTGPTGTGRSRLASWLAEWSHAEGLAEAIHATHGTGSGDGLLAAFSRYLRLDGLGDAGLRERLADVLGAGPYVDGLERILGGELLPRSVQQKTLASTLRAASDTIPLVVILDDIDVEGLDTLSAVLADLDTHPAPILFLLTAADEVLAERSGLQQALGDFVAAREVESLALKPLPRGMQRALVRSLLGLSGNLAETVERRSAGNPALAVQWVGHWVEHGLLVPGRRGLQLAPGTTAEPPADLLEVWRERLVRLTSGWSNADRTALELAALLGHRFTVSEWLEACRVHGVDFSDDLLAQLLGSQLATGEDEQLRVIRFGHGLLVEVLAERARASGRWEAMHAACGIAVERGQSPAPDRLSRHRLEAGQLEPALESLHETVEAQLEMCDARSDANLVRYRSTLDQLSLPEDDPRYADYWLVCAWMHRERGEFEPAEALAVRTREQGETYDWYMVPARALRELGRIAIAQGGFEKALGYFHRAARLATDVGRTEFAAHCVVQEGEALLYLGRLDDAREAFLEVHDAFEGTDAWQLSHEPPLALANGAIRAGEYDRAEAHLALARERAERARIHGALARITNFQGEVARHRGDLEGAARLYAEAATRMRELEHSGAAWPELNVGLCQVMAGRWADADARMAHLLKQVDGMPVIAACVRMVGWAAAAGKGDAETMDQLYAPLRAFLSQSQLAEKDLATLARIAADQSLRREWPDRAIQALEIRAEQLDRLGRETDARATRARLAALRRG